MRLLSSQAPVSLLPLVLLLAGTAAEWFTAFIPVAPTSKLLKTFDNLLVKIGFWGGITVLLNLKDSPKGKNIAYQPTLLFFGRPNKTRTQLDLAIFLGLIGSYHQRQYNPALKLKFAGV